MGAIGGQYLNSYLLGNGNYDLFRKPPLETALTEPLENIIQKIRDGRGEAKVSMTSIRKKDYEGLWAALDINLEDGKIIRKILKLEIHHLDDLGFNADGYFEGTLQLSTIEAHKATIQHTGNNNMYKKLLEQDRYTN